ncbi:SCP2 sterol-binding domain-containing protein [Halomarina litorea]|uniref:SCP2 sterol-binding domain-containing protein n=1 Tax=Halomarina litorea TaxID=2961595 RepID=UPI0020C3066F|nr:SCP2 sterol-binding domain-containing protein [Halomarina sp. BCD28]
METQTEPLYFPSGDWFDEYERAIRADEQYARQAEGWGVDFDGDIVFEMTKMPIDDIDMDALPASLREQLDQYVRGGAGGDTTGYALLRLEDGDCLGAGLVEDPDAVDHGFLLSATMEQWKALLDREVGIIDGLMSAKFDLDGDMQKILQYTDSAQRLTEIAASIDADYVDEEFDG